MTRKQIFGCLGIFSVFFFGFVGEAYLGETYFSFFIAIGMIASTVIGLILRNGRFFYASLGSIVAAYCASISGFIGVLGAVVFLLLSLMFALAEVKNIPDKRTVKEKLQHR